MSTIEVKEPVDNEEQEQQVEQNVDTGDNKPDTEEVTEEEVEEQDEGTNDDDEEIEKETEVSENDDDEEKADDTTALDKTLQDTKQSIEDASETLKGKGIDYNALSQEYEEKGGLSDATYKKLADAGYPKAVVDTYIRGVEAANEGYTQAVYAAAGGKDEYAKLQNYVASKGKAAVDTFNDVVQNGSLATMKMLISGLQAEMKVRNGTAKASVLGSGGSAAATGYANEDAMTKAMDDPRYGVDEDYTKAVTKRLAKTKFIKFGR